MLPGVFEAKKKDGTIYYRSNLTFKNKHISLGSYDSEAAAHQAYRVASSILTDTASIEDSYYMTYALPFQKIVSLINFRDNNMYISAVSPGAIELFKIQCMLYSNSFSFTKSNVTKEE